MGKVAYFEEVVGREVEARVRQETARVESELREREKRELAEAREREGARLAEAVAEMERNANRAVAEATRRAKADYNEARTRFFEEIKGEVISELKAFTQTAEYAGYLKEKIAAAWREGLDRVVLRPQDKDLAEEIKKSIGNKISAVEISEEDFLGGFILRGDKKQDDHTFITRLGELHF